MKEFLARLFPLLSKKVTPEEKPKKKLYLVETVSNFKMQYVVECDENKITDILEMDDVGEDLTQEYNQKHTNEKVISFKELDGEEHYLRLFEEDGHYLKEWTNEQKLLLINRK